MGGSGGAPARYAFTARGRNTISPWNETSCAYSILQIGLGYNPISKLEVASALNTVNIGIYMYHYHTINSTEKYAPKVYLGTTQTIATGWNMDIQNGTITTLPNWPNSYQSNTQKGEANLSHLKIC